MATEAKTSISKSFANLASNFDLLANTEPAEVEENEEYDEKLREFAEEQI